MKRASGHFQMCRSDDAQKCRNSNFLQKNFKNFPTPYSAKFYNIKAKKGNKTRRV